MTDPSSWPDRNAFWRDQRVVEKLQARGAAEVFVPCIEDDDLIDLSALRRMLAELSDQPGDDTVRGRSAADD